MATVPPVTTDASSSTHHHRLVPHGPWILDGDPEEPDGLRWHRIDESDVDARAGPAA